MTPAGRTRRRWPGSRPGQRGPGIDGLGVGAIVTSTAALLLVGSGMLAVTQSSVVSAGNTVATGTFDAGPGLSIATAGTARKCDTAEFGEGPVGALVVADAPVDEAGWSTTGQIVCVRNDSATALTLTSVATAVEDVELGPCAQLEIDAGDLTCADGDAGELASVVEVGQSYARSGGPSSPGCTSSGVLPFADWREGAPTPVTLGTIAVGEICAWRIAISLADDEQLLALAQSDRLTWDQTIVGTPVEATT